MTLPVFCANRRRFLSGSAAAALTTGLIPALALAAATPVRALLDTMAYELMALEPEQATGLGLDKGDKAALKSQLSDLSPAANAVWARQMDSMKSRLSGLDRAQLSDSDRLRVDTTLYAVDAAQRGAKFKYGGNTLASGFNGGASPYIVSQQNGAVSSIPEFLNTQHQINTAADAEAYLERVSALARLIDQESDVIASDAALGVMPPDFIAANALGQLKDFRATATKDQGLVSSLTNRAQKAGLAGDWADRCNALIEKAVYPAVERQIAALSKATANAPHIAGVQRLPDGDAYYAWALRMGTTTETAAADIHAMGLQQNQDIKARIDTLLRKQGLTQGSVGERVQLLNKDPRFLYPDTDAGRADLVAYLNGCIARIRSIIPQLSNLNLKAAVEVKRVPVSIQDGAPLGYMNFASLDGARPAIYYINLKTTSLWPKYQLPTLTAHEGIPGHTWQGAYLAEHNADIPLMSSLIGFNAFVEGWALYAEQLVDEHGLYADDPFGEIGYLQAQQFRACRLVVDTGLNAMHWTREQSVQFLTEQTGKGPAAMTSEVDRYCASPGQACGYKMGHNEILRLRAKTVTKLGKRFNLQAFNDTVVRTGGVPLSLLEPIIDAYIKSLRKG